MRADKPQQPEPAPDAIAAALERIEESARTLSGVDATRDVNRAALVMTAQACHLGNNAELIRSHVAELRDRLEKAEAVSDMADTLAYAARTVIGCIVCNDGCKEAIESAAAAFRAARAKVQA